MKSPKFAMPIACLLLTATLIGCGSDDANDPAPPIQPPGAVIGPVSAANPLTVSGMVIDRGTFAFSVEDDDDDRRGIQPGMIARVEGALGAGDASIRATKTMLSRAELRGPITSLNGDGTYSVMGVAVLITPQTVLEGPIPAKPATVGDMVQVHGYPYFTGGATGESRLVATRIQWRGNNAIYKTVVTLGLTASTTPCPTCPIAGVQLRLPSLTINVPPSALRGVNFPISAGTMLRVRAAAPVNGIATATEVSNFVTDPLLADARTTLRGILLTSAADDFRLGGYTLRISAQTTITGGTRSELVNARFVEVRGIYRSGAIEVGSIRLL